MDWRIRDFTEAIFYDRRSAVGVVPAAVRQLHAATETHPANRLKVLVSRRDRIVAAAGLFTAPAPALDGTATLEVLCHPTYHGELSSFSGRGAGGRPRGRGANRVRLCLGRQPQRRAGRGGLTVESTLSGYLRAATAPST